MTDELKFGPLIYVKWRDAAGMKNDGWKYPEDLDWITDEEGLEVETVGWVVFEDDLKVILAAQRSVPNDGFARVTNIPKAMIQKRTTIRLASK